MHADAIDAHRPWDKAETFSADERVAVQLRRLGQSLRQAVKTPFYSEQFRQTGFHPEDLTSLADIQRLPFTTKADVHARYPLGLLAVPREEVARFYVATHIEHKPILVAQTKNELKIWADLMARFFYAGGLRDSHTVCVASVSEMHAADVSDPTTRHTIACSEKAHHTATFADALGWHDGVARIGAAVLPVSNGTMMQQFMLLRDVACDALIGTPAYALALAEAMRVEGVEPSTLPISYGYFRAGIWPEDLRARIEREFGLRAFYHYGCSEVMASGIGGECAMQNGMHMQEDHFLVECIHPDTLMPVVSGEVGELVLTSLTKEAMPMVRYRTGTMIRLCTDTCPCGRTTVRMQYHIG